jgi:DNA-binding NtrC family response regulator
MATILLIDDDRGIRHLLHALLSRKGYEVELAENGPRGLELLNQKQPDVIVLDLKMPEMDGVTVLKEIRRIDPRQPVIMFTGACTPKTEQEIRALGVSEIVKKEFSLERLEEALRRSLKTPHTVG